MNLSAEDVATARRFYDKAVETVETLAKEVDRLRAENDRLEKVVIQQQLKIGSQAIEIERLRRSCGEPVPPQDSGSR